MRSRGHPRGNVRGVTHPPVRRAGGGSLAGMPRPWSDHSGRGTPWGRPQAAERPGTPRAQPARVIGSAGWPGSPSSDSTVTTNLAASAASSSASRGDTTRTMPASAAARLRALNAK